MTPPAPTSIRYRIIAVSMLMAFILYLDRICLGEIVKSASFQADVPLTKDQIGKILGAFFFTYALFQVPTGWLSDRFGARLMLTSYIVLWSLFTGLTGLMSSFAGLLVMRLCCGFAEAGAYPTSQALIRRWSPLVQRARSSALVSFGGRIGGTLAPWLTALLIIQLGSWRYALALDGIAGLGIAALYWRVIRNRPSEHPACNEAEFKLIGSPRNEPPLTRAEFFSAMGAFCRSRSLWLIAAVQFLINVGWVFLVAWLPTYLKEARDVEDVRGARMVTLVLAAGMVGQLVGGWLADAWVRRSGLRWGRVWPMFFSCLFAACAYALCPRMTSIWGLVACCAAVSFMADVNNPTIWAFMQDVGGRVTAAAGGWTNMWGNFGASIGAMLVPKLWILYGGKLGATGAYLLSRRRQAWCPAVRRGAFSVSFRASLA